MLYGSFDFSSSCRSKTFPSLQHCHLSEWVYKSDLDRTGSNQELQPQDRKRMWEQRPQEQRDELNEGPGTAAPDMRAEFTV